ncbi:hypothetical protein D3C80_1711710 [compost metagenome]
MGSFMLHEDAPKDEPVEQALLAAFPEWQRFESKIVFVPQDESMQYAYLQKAVLELTTERPDVYIMDRTIFEWIGKQGILMNLDDDVQGNFASLVKNNTLLKLTTTDDPTEHVYGIDLSKSALAGHIPMYAQDLIIGIRVDSERVDKAKAFIKKYMATIE